MGNFEPIKLKILKKLNKRDAYEAVIRELEDLTEYYFRNYTKNSVRENIMERMKDEKNYARYIKHACKVEDENPFPDGFSFILIEFLSKYGTAAMDEENLNEVCKIYGNALDKMCKSRTKKIAKSLDLPKDVAMELAVIYPGERLNKHNAWIFNKELQRRLTQMQFRTAGEEPEAEKPKAETTTTKKSTSKTNAAATKPAEPEPQIEPVQKLSECNLADKKLIKKIYKGFFGDDEDVLVRVYANLLLDKQIFREHLSERQKEFWDATTEFLVDAIEKMPLKVVKNIADMFVARRTNDKSKDSDQKRRVLFSELEYERAPKLVTVFNPDEYNYKKALKDEKKKSKKKSKKKGKR